MNIWRINLLTQEIVLERVAFRADSFHYASDVALQFIEAALQDVDRGYGYNLGTKPARIADIVAMIRSVRPEAQITFDENSLPFPDCDGQEYHSQPSFTEAIPLEDGFCKTIEYFESSLNEGRLQWKDS